MPQRAALIAASAVLVVVAAGLLAGGLVSSDSSRWFLASIGSSLVSAVALLAAGRPAPAGSQAPVVERRGSAADDGWLLAGEPPSPSPPPMPLGTEPADVVPTGGVAGERVPADPEPLFPIADYDDLTTDEVLGLLPRLYSEELDVVEDRERQGRARPLVLAKLAALRRSGTDADREPGPPTPG